jgi:hypothetical protein
MGNVYSLYTMSIQLSKYNEYSAVLTVMSSIDPHMISGTWDGFWLSLWLGCVKVGLLGCWSVTVRLCDAIEVVIVEEMSLLTCLLD